MRSSSKFLDICLAFERSLTSALRVQQLDPRDYVHKMFNENLIHYTIATLKYTAFERNEPHAAI